MQKKFIFYIILIIVILILVFLSQQPYSRDIIKNISSYLNKYAGASLLNALGPNPVNKNPSANPSSGNGSASAGSDSPYKLTDSAYSSTDINAPNAKNAIGLDTANKEEWTISSIPEKVAESIKSGGEVVSSGINNAKEKISENISTTEKNIVNYFSGISDAIQGKENNSGNCQCPTGQ